ncbi:unnamed protein product [Ambrosiozyma monospora]|uniref:Unnamed protein product n=1 Tax=Ambrosiozyma monospora TaxID=43982 RepID=A0ACB5TUU7_AMBMO|nr:unnamed protein product [Ambrosiozyma monospora]
MSDVQALYIFLRKPVSTEMIDFLVSTTNSIIQIQPTSLKKYNETPPLSKFIQNLITYSHVQTPTLMSTLVYLTRLGSILPPNSTGMETTRHRIFLGALILAAKNLNDSSPMNKHWCKYTDGLLSLKDINALEVELIGYLGWQNLRITNLDLLNNFSYFLAPIKSKLRKQMDLKLSKDLKSGEANWSW